MENPNRFFFNKNEKLTSKKLISELFKNGRSVFSNYLNAKFLFVEKQNVPFKVLITVPKKNFRSAVKRNRIKRIIREAFRLNNELFKLSLKHFDKTIIIVFYYSSNLITDFNTISISVKKLLKDITAYLKNNE